MSELRQDPVTRDWVIVSPERSQRPDDSAHAAADAHAACPFCPGREDATPPELDRIEDGERRWLVRAVPNRYPALNPRAGAGVAHELTAEGWHRLPASGRHEVIVETPDHDASLATIGAAQLRRVLEMYVRRYRALAAADGLARQVVLFRNQGRRAGTSLTHPHSQIVATPVVAPETRWRLAEEIEYFDANGCCGVCHVVERELDAGARIVALGTHFVTLAPYASRVPYHVQVILRRHCPEFTGINAAELDELAGHLAVVLGALHRALANPDYNLVVVTPPLDQTHQHANHWFIDVLPRLTTPAGFELGSRIVVTVQTPERAAAELRALADGEGGA